MRHTGHMRMMRGPGRMMTGTTPSAKGSDIGLVTLTRSFSIGRINIKITAAAAGSYQGVVAGHGILRHDILPCDNLTLALGSHHAV